MQTFSPTAHSLDPHVERAIRPASVAAGRGVRAVLFDLCGVLLIKQDAAGRASIEQAAGCSGPEFWDAYWAERPDYDAGIAAPIYWARVQRRLGRRIADLKATIAADVDASAHPDDTMVAAVSELLGGPTRFGILSNITPDMAVRVEREQPWLAGFDAVVWSCEHRVTKPEPAAFRVAQQQLGVPAEQILFVDDDLHNIKAAAAFGMLTHHFDGLPGLLLKLSEHHLLYGGAR